MIVNGYNAAGAAQLSSRSDVPTSLVIASQMPRQAAEPEQVPAISKAQAGGHCVTRRNIMNIAVSSAALAVAPSVALLDVPDAEVVAAGKKFEALFTKYVPMWLEWAKLARQAKQETIAKFGVEYGNPAWSKPSLGESPAHLFLMEAHDRLGAGQVDRAMFAVDEEIGRA
jgi:hypothetical protein